VKITVILLASVFISYVVRCFALIYLARSFYPDLNGPNFTQHKATRISSVASSAMSECMIIFMAMVVVKESDHRIATLLPLGASLHGKLLLRYDLA